MLLPEVEMTNHQPTREVPVGNGEDTAKFMALIKELKAIREVNTVAA